MLRPFQPKLSLLLFIYSLIEITLTNHSLSQMHSPRCLLKYNGTEEKCAFFGGLKSQYQQFKPFKISYRRWSQNNMNYMNLSVVYNHSSETFNFDVVETWPDVDGMTETWNIKPTLDPDSILYPALLTASYIPLNGTSDSPVFLIHRIDEKGNSNYRSTCDKYKAECATYEHFESFFSPVNDKVTFKFTNSKIQEDLKVEVLQSDCDINCTNYSNNCTVMTSYYTWNQSHPAIYVPVLNSSQVFARINPAHDCCKVLCTETHNITKQANLNAVHRVKQQISYLAFVWVLGFIFFMIFIAASVQGFTKCPCFSNVSSNDMIEQESAPLSPLFKPFEICLLYKLEPSESFQNCVEKLKNLVSRYATNVWDPFDNLEEVSENDYAWIRRVLESKWIKIILVENRSSINWQNQESSELSSKPHHIDALFNYTLNTLSHTSQNYNYNRLFVVRLDFTLNDEEYINFVPCTRYKLPNQILSLIEDLTELKRNSTIWEANTEDDRAIMHQLQELTDALNDYNGIKEK